MRGDCMSDPIPCEDYLKIDIKPGPAIGVKVNKEKQEIKSLPIEAANRKQYPVASGVLAYFPDALIEVAHVSYYGNQQHNPGEPLHWAREKSTDHSDCLIRHFMERGTVDTDGLRHSAKMVWRALAILQLEIEANNKNKE